MWRSSVATEIALRSCVSSSRERKTISTPSESPRRIRSPWERIWSVALVPFTNVPNFESQSRGRPAAGETPVPATDVAFAPAAERHDSLVDGHLTTAGGVGDDEARGRRAHFKNWRHRKFETSNVSLPGR